MKRKIQGIFFLVVIIFWLPAQVICQIEIVGLDPNKTLTQYNFDYWDIDNGMYSNTVLDNLLTSDGYMWMASYDGLVRFDGFNFEAFNERTHPQFKKNGVLSLFEDQDSILWIGSNGGGLLSYKKGAIKVYGRDLPIQNQIISDIAQDANGTLWLATRKGVRKFFNGEFSQENDLSVLSNNIIFAILIDRKGKIWMGTAGNGLYSYDGTTLVHYSISDGLDDNDVRSIYEDRAGKIWIGTNSGINILENGFVTQLELPEIDEGFFVNDIIEDPFGAFWFATDVGLIKLYRGKFEILREQNGLVDNNVQSLSFDNEGSLWMGSYRRGIGRLKDGKFKNFGVLEGLLNQVVNIAYVDENVVWIGTDHGLSRLEDDQITSYKLGEGYQKNRVRDILRDSQGQLWICTYNGLVLFHNGKVVKRYLQKDGLSSEELRVIREDREGNIWIGTANGLNKFNNKSFIKYGTESGLKNKFIMSIFEDHKGQIWVGTDGGGIHKFVDDMFVAFDEKDGLASNVVFQISENKKGHLLIGTNGGITLFDGQQFNSLDFNHGLYSNSVFQVIIDSDQNYWLMTNKGVQKIEGDELYEVIQGDSPAINNLVTYNHSEGMRSSVITGASISAIGEDGHILVPTFKGLTVIDPNEIPLNNIKPPVYITEMRLNNLSVNLNKQILLPAGKETLEIDYTGLSLYAPDEVTFQYKLEGFDTEWQKVGNRRTAYYTNLPPNDYVFKVKAGNNDGIWNEEGDSISFSKEAYFYQTKFFPITLFAIIAILILIVHRARTARLKSKNLELLEIIDRRTQSIQKQNQEITLQKEELKQLNAIKDKLFSIVSHDLRGPINSFSGILGLLNSDNITQEEIKTLTGNLGSDLNRLRNLLENLLNWSRSQMQGIKVHQEVIELKPLVEENFDLFQKEAVRKQIAFKNAVKENTMVYADLNMTKLILRNLINNAIKFTPRDGSVKVGVEEMEQFMEVAITDNGIGIPDEIRQKLFDKDFHYSKIGTSKEDGSGIGLLLCKEFIEENGGKIWIESEEGKGSTFKLYFKKPPLNGH